MSLVSVGNCDTGGYTFIWIIKGFKLSPETFNKYFDSVNFRVGGLDASWNLRLYPRGNKCYGKSIVCCLMGNTTRFEIHCEMCICTRSGERLSVGKKGNCKLDRPDYGTSTTTVYEAVFDRMIDSPTLQDTLVLHCHMWSINSPLTETRIECYEITYPKIVKHTFVWKIEQFSTIKLHAENVFLLNNGREYDDPAVKFKLTLSGSTLEDAYLLIAIQFKNVRNDLFYKGGISLIDRMDNPIKFMKYEELFTNNCKNMKFFPHFLNRRALMTDKASFIPGDVLTLKCEIIFSDPNRHSQVYYTYGLNKIDKLAMYRKPLSDIMKEECCNFFEIDMGKISDNMDAPSDFKLSAGGEAFAVQRCILAERSPVFKAMLENGMLEKDTSLDLPDLDSLTLTGMLLYVYMDTALETFGWKEVARLYFAADKYQMSGLRWRCSAMLNSRLDISNAAETLALADRHGDRDLKGAVQDYVFSHDTAVLDSDEWKHLEAENPQLALETLRLVLFKNVRSTT